ncbi:MAG TPA: DUF3137 domain-containing protein [Gemmatimonadaceae bacterium]|nr:DUF3137 domain-containing protein [Gemmatimonadaceae bacterium]
MAVAVNAQRPLKLMRTGRDVRSLEPPTLGRVQPVCSFVNAEVARLRNMSIAIGAACAIGAILFPLLTRIGDVRIPLVLAGGIFAVWFVRARRELVSHCTNLAAKRFVAAMNRGLSYKAGSSLTQQQFQASDLFRESVHRWSSHDEIAGRADGVRFTLHRVRATAKARGEMVFDGVVIKIDFASGFPGHTVVVPDGDAGPIGNRVKKDLVMLKHPTFEKHFSVFASDYYEARRLVSPHLMEVVLAAAPSFPDGIRMAFVARSLFVAVRTEGLRVDAPLFGAPLTPETAVGPLMRMVTFAEALAASLDVVGVHA